MLPTYSLVPKPTRLPLLNAKISATRVLILGGCLADTFTVLHMVAFEKLSLIEEHDGLGFALDKYRKIGMRNEQLLAHAKHRVAHIIHAHDQFRRRLLSWPRSLPGRHRLHDVFLLFRRRYPGEQDFDVDFAEQIFCFLDMRAAGVFLEERTRASRVSVSLFSCRSLAKA